MDLEGVLLSLAEGDSLGEADVEEQVQQGLGHFHPARLVSQSGTDLICTQPFEQTNRLYQHPVHSGYTPLDDLRSDLNLSVALPAS